MKTTYVIEDLSRTTRRGFEDLVEAPNKGLKVLEVFTEFECRYEKLSARDQTILLPDKVVMLLCAVDARDCQDLGVLLDDTTTESGLTSKWETIKSIVARFTKRRQWLENEEYHTFDQTLRSKASSDNSQQQSRENTIEKGVDASVIEQILKGLEDFKDCNGEEDRGSTKWLQIWRSTVHLV
jgi:SOS response regulatory protein OraA/RecX